MTTTVFVVLYKMILVLNTFLTLMTKPYISSMTPATVMGRVQTCKPDPELTMQLKLACWGHMIVVMLSAPGTWHKASLSSAEASGQHATHSAYYRDSL